MQQAIEFSAVISSAVFGVLLARRNGMDVVGVFSMAFVVAFGGGTLRDVLLDRHPLFWIQNAHYPVIVFAIAIVTSFLPRLPNKTEKLLAVPDALGLGLFSIAGAAAAIEAGTSLFIAALMGAVTGTFGGVIADIICNRVPSLFRPAPVFATCSFFGCWIYFGFDAMAWSKPFAAVIGIGVIVVARLIAVYLKLQLPNVEKTLGESKQNPE